MCGSGDGVRAQPLSVFDTSVNTRPNAEGGAQGHLAKKGQITVRVNVRVDCTLQFHIFSGVVCTLL